MNKVVHCKKAAYDVYIGRPSKWGNPYSHKTGTTAKYKTDTRAEAIEKYRDYILYGDGKHLLKELHELKGKTLGCWCSPLPCHGDILSQLIIDLKI
jgi:hypothetical protein